MSVQSLVRLAAAGFAALLLAATPVTPSLAQQPSKSAMSLANEILDIKGSMTIFEAVIPGVIEKSKATLLQMNPNLFKDLNEVATNLRKELAPRLESLRAEIAQIYAVRFTEQEMKDTIAFYKSPLGKKILSEEPTFVDRSMSAAQDWAIKLNDEVLQRFRAEMKKRGHSL
ncbi:DUF2059 domain-containing protein [Pseudorhodoplanes sp.]|uniref:DUF2059 domain-containing protein n=1 Tax=Pseudorhodoplanes sp. TaxID=1934341 RepID=UPI002CC14DA8|nr:DUF2059 domain-containing protein [Pseudorhodoplanes sp.]HWV55111.1 DUF2059 domain-containing protein [Pseudorhodoplanes sp.]